MLRRRIKCVRQTRFCRAGPSVRRNRIIRISAEHQQPDRQASLRRPAWENARRTLIQAVSVSDNLRKSTVFPRFFAILFLLDPVAHVRLLFDYGVGQRRVPGTSGGGWVYNNSVRKAKTEI